MTAFIELGEENGFYVNSQTLLQDRQSSKVHRVIASFARKKPKLSQKTALVIKDANNAYTPEYIDLLRDYMLNF